MFAYCFRKVGLSMRNFRKATLLYLFLISVSFFSFGNTQFMVPNRWEGELLSNKSSAFLLRIQLMKFKKKLVNVPIFRVELFDPLLKKSYVFHHPANVSHQNIPIWVVKPGKYRLKSLSLVAGIGNSWQATMTQSRSLILMKKKALTNLGLWQLSPAGKKYVLDLKIQKRSPLKLREQKKLSSFLAVVNGYSGLIERWLTGKSKAKSRDGDTRIHYHYQKKIGMFFKLNLFRHHAHAKKIASVLNHQDSSLRTCYADRLEDFPKLSGHLSFQFVMAKKIKGIQKLKIKNSSIKDSKLVECFYYKLLAIDFPVEENMIGELKYTFQVHYSR